MDQQARPGQQQSLGGSAKLGLAVLAVVVVAPGLGGRLKVEATIQP